jgi:curli biogenesis system outer membrane secretion channel CsgG
MVYGRGPTEQDAINSCLIEAVGRVNGKSIDAVNQINKVSQTVNRDGDKSRASQTDIQRKFKEATKGLISSYEVLTATQADNGYWTAQIKAKIAKFKLSQDANRKRIAVLPFRTSGQTFTVRNQKIEKTQLTRVLSQELISGLVQSRRFTVLEREYMEEVAAEKKLVMDSMTSSIEDIARLGQALVVDYILVGTLESLSFSEYEKKLRSSDNTIIVKSAFSEVSYRIIDVPTKQIKFADNARFNFSTDELSFAGGNIETAILSLASEKISTKVLNAIYPILVVSVNDRFLNLNQGGDLINAGDIYDLYVYGDRMYDPYTKESIGREERLIGSLMIEKVNPKFSIAKVLSADLDLASSFSPKKFVCRFKSKAPTQSELRSQQRTSDRKKRKEIRDSDW